MNNRQGTSQRPSSNHDNTQPKRPTRVEEPLSVNAARPYGAVDDIELLEFDPGEETATMEVTPNGTQRATRRTRPGNASTVLAQTQRMYDDRDSARKMQQQMRAEELAHRASMERMRQDYQVTRDRMRAEMSATRRAMEDFCINP